MKLSGRYEVRARRFHAAERKQSSRGDHLRIVRVAVGSRRLATTHTIRKWRFQSMRGDHLRLVIVVYESLVQFHQNFRENFSKFWGNGSFYSQRRLQSTRGNHLRIVRVAIGSRRLVVAVSIRKWRFQSTRGEHLRIGTVGVSDFIRILRAREPYARFEY